MTFGSKSGNVTVQFDEVPVKTSAEETSMPFKINCTPLVGTLDCGEDTLNVRPLVGLTNTLPAAGVMPLTDTACSVGYTSNSHNESPYCVPRCVAYIRT